MTREPTRPVLAFDVYGTLIDPFRMEEHLRAAFGARAKEASELWRGKQLEYSFRRALMKQYRNFDECTSDALRFVSAQLEIPLSADTQTQLLARYRQLPAFPDVVDALEEFATRGYTMAACSNGTHSSVRSSLEHAGVLRFFSKIVSVDSIHTFKPDPAVYEFLVSELQASREMVWLISSNPFDAIGAKACGLHAVWVQRDPKRVFDPWELQPDLVVHSLHELKEALANR